MDKPALAYKPEHHSSVVEDEDENEGAKVDEDHDEAQERDGVQKGAVEGEAHKSMQSLQAC